MARIDTSMRFVQYPARRHNSATLDTAAYAELHLGIRSLPIGSGYSMLVESDRAAVSSFRLVVDRKTATALARPLRPIKPVVSPYRKRELSASSAVGVVHPDQCTDVRHR